MGYQIAVVEHAANAEVVDARGHTPETRVHDPYTPALLARSSGHTCGEFVQPTL